MGNLQRKNIDLLRAYRQHSTKKSKIPSWAKMIIPPLVVFLLFASVFAYATLQTNRYNRQLKETKAEIAALEGNGTSEEIAEYTKVVETNKKKVKNLQGVVDNMATYPRLNKASIDAIVAACGRTVDIKSITFNEMYGTIVIVAQTPYVYDTADFITRLKNTGIFSAVGYSGYASQVVDNTTDTETNAEETTTDEKTTDENTTDEKTTEEKKTTEKTTPTVKQTAAGVYEMNITCVLKVGA